MRDLHNKVVCGTNATEPSTEADAPAESKLARGRCQANLSFSAKDDRAVRTAIFFVLFEFNKKFSFLNFGLILPFDLDHLLQYMRLECLFLTKQAIILLVKSLASCFITFPNFFCKFLTNPFLKNAVLFGCFILYAGAFSRRAHFVLQNMTKLD